MTKRVLTAFILAASVTAAAGHSQGAAKEAANYNIPKMTKPPTVDGTIDQEEWREAVRLTGGGVNGNPWLYIRPVTFWWAWDDEHLYIACRSAINPGEKLLKNKRERYSAGVVFDDSYEFGIFMGDRNRLPDEVSSFFKLIVNPLTCGEYLKMYPSIGQYLYNWRPEQRIGSSITPDGKWWEMEQAFHLKDLQMPIPNKAGDGVRLLMARNFHNPAWVQSQSQVTTSFLSHESYGPATLTDDRPYVQVEELTGLIEKTLSMKSVVYNPSDRTVKILASCAIEQVRPKTNAASVLAEERVLEIPARGMARFDVTRETLDVTLKGRESHGVLNLRFAPAEAAGAAPVFAYACQFTDDYDGISDPTDPAKHLVSLPSPRFQFSARFNPVQSRLWIEGDTLDADIPKDRVPAGMRYEVRSGETVITNGLMSQRVGEKYQGLLVLPALEPGAYMAVGSLVDASGQTLITATNRFSKKDEAKEFPEWWGKNYGNPDQLLKPFEALKSVRGEASRAAVSCALRQYEFDSLGLPVAISANGGPVLKGPVRMALVVNGREFVVPTRKNLKFTEKTDWRFTFEGEPCEAAGLRFQASGMLEQDGLVSVELTYGPVAGPVEVQELRIEWPVDDALRNYIACIGVGGNYSARFIDAVPAGRGVVWSTLKDIGAVGSGMTVGNFYQNLWVGTEKRGLLWWGNSDEGWAPNDAVAAHDIVRRDGATVLRNHLIGTHPTQRPFTLVAPRTVRFSYNASPFRKLTKGWRLNQTAFANGFRHFTYLSPPMPEKEKWPEYFEKQRKAAEAAISRYRSDCINNTAVGIGIAARGYGPKTAEPGLYDYFGPDWMVVEGAETMNPSYCDYMMYIHHLQAKEGGCRHFYYDISMCGHTTRDVVAGLGYVLPDGRIQPAGMDGTLRQWYLRSSAVMQNLGYYPSGVSGHATQAIPLLALPFCQAVLEGEFPFADAIDSYPTGRMIAMSCPHNFGVNITYLNYFNPHWAAMHDAAGYTGGLPFDRGEFRNWGIEREDIEFVPYWRNEAVVSRIGDGLLCSLWKRPAAPGSSQPPSAVVCVMNYGPDAKGFETTRPCELTLNLQALGIPAGASAEQVRVGEFFRDGRAPRHLKSHAWYKELEGKELPWDDTKKRPPFVPKLDLATGALTGFDIFYHDQMYLAITWNEKPAASAWRERLGEEILAPALDWGIDGAQPVVDGLVATETEGVSAQAWKRPGSVLVLLENPGEKALDARMELDIAQLGLEVKPERLLHDFVQVYELDRPKERPCPPNAGYDGRKGVLTRRLDAGSRRLLCVDRY